MAGLPFCNRVFLIRTFVLICSVCPRFALYMWHVGVYYYYHLVSFLSLDRIDIGYFLLRNMPLWLCCDHWNVTNYAILRKLPDSGGNELCSMRRRYFTGHCLRRLDLILSLTRPKIVPDKWCAHRRKTKKQQHPSNYWSFVFQFPFEIQFKISDVLLRIQVTGNKKSGWLALQLSEPAARDCGVMMSGSVIAENYCLYLASAAAPYDTIVSVLSKSLPLHRYALSQRARGSGIKRGIRQVL